MKHPSTDLLLVEDNAYDAELTLATLHKHPDAGAVSWVRNGEEALEFLFSTGEYQNFEKIIRRPKVILLDIHMPKIDGFELLARLKQNKETRSIPVVMLTSSNESPDIKKCYELGANSYVVKPLTSARFTSAITTLENYGMAVG